MLLSVYRTYRIALPNGIALQFYRKERRRVPIVDDDRLHHGICQLYFNHEVDHFS